MSVPNVELVEVVGALSERGQLEWELAYHRVLVAKLSRADGIEFSDES